MNKLPQHPLLLLCILLFAAACNNGAGNPSLPDTGAAKTDTAKVMVPVQTCYTGVQGKDSFFLKTERFPDAVTGTLTYKFYEKDQSRGELAGKMHGDTLVADYTFISEGQSSVRQVAFLLSGDVAREGYGAQEEREGKMVFKNPGQLSFTGAVILGKVVCSGH